MDGSGWLMMGSVQNIASKTEQKALRMWIPLG